MKLFSLLLIPGLFTGCLSATPLLVSGILPDADSLAVHVFQVVAPSALTLQSLSYGGGTSLSGPVIAPGGFDPSIYLFEGTGPGAALIGQNDDGSCPLGQPDPVTAACLDATLNMALLAPGDYTLVIAVYGNVPIGLTLGDGFSGGGNFEDVFASLRTGNYAVDLNLTQSLLAPEPSSSALVLAALGLVLLRRPRRTVVIK
jgi:hypothetical protein